MKQKNKKLTTASGKPYVEHENTMSVGAKRSSTFTGFYFARENVPLQP